MRKGTLVIALTINGIRRNADVPPDMPLLWVLRDVLGLDLEVIQCGYCQSGQIMSASALLDSIPHPDDADIDAAMAGNICRCGTYVRIRQAIKRATADE